MIERNKIVGNKGVGVLVENEAEPKIFDNVISDVSVCQAHFSLECMCTPVLLSYCVPLFRENLQTP